MDFHHIRNLLPIPSFSNMASWETIVCTNLGKSKMAAKLCAKSGFQTFSGTFHYGLLPKFTNSFVDEKYSPSSILGEFGQNPRWLPGIKHSPIVQKMVSK
jgi:hypothetical protein